MSGAEFMAMCWALSPVLLAAGLLVQVVVILSMLQRRREVRRMHEMRCSRDSFGIEPAKPGANPVPMPSSRGY
jgi:hypothetical protein